MARQLVVPGSNRGRKILSVLKGLGESFTLYGQRCGLTFNTWHRVLHADGDPNVETTIAAKIIKRGMPLHLVAPKLHEALLECGWKPPAEQIARSSAEDRVA